MKARRTGAAAGTMASKSGSEMAAPRPRSRVRRENLTGIGYDQFDELREGFVTANGCQGSFAAERVGGQLGSQAARKAVLILEQRLLQGFGPLAGVDWQIAILSAPMADGVVVFEAETEGVHARVATFARWIGAMLFQALADRGRDAEGRFIELGNVGRRWRRRGVQQVFQDPFSTNDGRSARRIRRHGQHAGLGEDAAAVGIGRKFDAAKLRTFNPRDAIEGGQPLV